MNAATGEPVRDVRVTLVEPGEGDAAGADGCACERGEGHWIEPKGSPWARTEQARVCRTTGLVETPEFTGDDGRFQFTGLRDRPHWIRVRYYGRRVGAMQVAADATEIRIPRAFFPRYYPGAPVGFEGLAPGRHLLWIVANMRTAGQRDARGTLLDVEVAGQEPIHRTLRLEPAALLTVVVTDARTGRAIAPATVTLRWEDRPFHRGTTDRYGAVTLESPAGQPVAIAVAAEGYEPAGLQAASRPAGAHELGTIALQPRK
ncbi:MAG: carboxypeptidase-like regulatory domain-containing protein [Planctomycetota bacterium]